MASVLGEALGPSNGFTHAIKGRVRRGVDLAPYRLDVTRTVPARSLMGLVAFLVLISAEVGPGVVLSRSFVDQLASSGSAAGAIGLAAQVVFATFPVTQIRWG